MILFFIMEAVKVPTLERCVEIFGLIYGKGIHSELLLSEFRNAKTLKEQKHFFKENISSASVKDICSVLNISSRVYYKA